MRHSSALALICLFAGPAGAREIAVKSATDIRAAMQNAQAGDIISIPPGEYDMGDGTVITVA